MTSDLEKMAGVNPEVIPQIDLQRKQKIFRIAKKLNKAFWLETAYQDKWLLIALFKIDGQVYEIVHDLDADTATEHAELFKSAMFKALEDYQQKNGIITQIH